MAIAELHPRNFTERTGFRHYPIAQKKGFDASAIRMGLG
jgi:hypothetical protein